MILAIDIKKLAESLDWQTVINLSISVAALIYAAVQTNLSIRNNQEQREHRLTARIKSNDTAIEELRLDLQYHKSMIGHDGMLAFVSEETKSVQIQIDIIQNKLDHLSHEIKYHIELPSHKETSLIMQALFKEVSEIKAVVALLDKFKYKLDEI